MKKLVICIAGKNEIAIDCMKFLKENFKEHTLVGIPNKNDKGLDGYYKSYRKFLKENEIDIVSLEDIYKEENLLFISAEFDRILNVEKFSTDRLFNIHFSKLPEYKGVYTSALPILHGKKETGVTLHKIDEGIDTGDIVSQKTIKIEESDTCDSLYRKYMKYGFILFRENISNLIKGSFKLIPQPKEGSTYFSRKSIDYANLKIDLNKTAWEIRNQIRAFYCPAFQKPVVHGYTIGSAEILDSRSREKPGKVIAKEKNYFVISTIDYDIKLFIEE